MLSEKIYFTNSHTVWQVAVYIRLSKEDGNDESLSVTNQRKIISDYLEHTFEGVFNLVDYYVDDGQSGTDYERTNFQRMLSDIEKGIVNCVVCKNLSRAFRNYADQGYFLESYFPRHGVRFISISNPAVDSYLSPDAIIQGLEVPITGLMNDRYAGKTSADIRRTFDTKRKNGEFIGAFAPYGYKKAEQDKNSLVIDEEAAQVVRDIFQWFTAEGMSRQGIAKRLNEMAVPNPTKYKRQNGLPYNNPHLLENDGLWSPCTVTRILKNQVYIGNMVQGRQKVISYKVHDRVAMPESCWYIVANTHEPIIEKETFQKAQDLQQRHIRAGKEMTKHYLFSGFIRCADCKKVMTRKKAKDFVYYACRTYTEKTKQKCTKHSIRADLLEKVVLATIQKQIEVVGDIAGIIEEINAAPHINTKSKRLEKTLKQQEKELCKVNSILDGLYLDWKSGEITKQQYHRLKEKHLKQSEQLNQQIESTREQIQKMEQGITKENPMIDTFLKYRNIQSLDRGILTELVKNIYVHADKSITIEFTFADEYQRILDFIVANQKGGKSQNSV